MAEGKKSFIAYCDWIDTFEALPDEDAGKLIKHMLRYINDLEPDTDDVLINAVFANIKTTLKRDLDKYDKIKIKRSESGKLGGRPKKQSKAKKANGFSEKQSKAKKAVSDSVSVSVSVNEKKEYKYSRERIILNSIHHLFDCKYLDTPSKKNKWLDTIRLLLTTDKEPDSVIIDVIKFGRNDEFWKSNFLTISGLRKKNTSGVTKYDQIKAKMKLNNSNGNDYDEGKQALKDQLGIR